MSLLKYCRSSTEGLDKMGKNTLIEDQYSRTEKLHSWDRADRKVKINTRRKRMPWHTQNSNNDDTKGDSAESTDSGTYITTGKCFSYPPLIFTDPEYVANILDSDTIDSVTERPQLSNYVGEYLVQMVQMYMQIRIWLGWWPKLYS